MHLTVLLDNTVLPEGHIAAFSGKALHAEHGSSFYIEADQKQFLFDLGFTDLFAQNAKKMDISLQNIDQVIFSHHHYDHTGGIRYLKDVSKCNKIVSHQYAVLSRSDGDNLLAQNIHNFEWIHTLDIPITLTENFIFLGQIPSSNDFETRENWGQMMLNETSVNDYCLDDSALLYKSQKGLIIVTGCSHSGICNIVRYGKKVGLEKWNVSKVYAVIGGMHLIEKTEDFLNKVTCFFKNESVEHVYPSHCTDLYARIAFAKAGLNVHEMGTGKELQF